MSDKRLAEFEHTISSGGRVLKQLTDVAKANKLNVPPEGLKDLKGIVLIHSHKGAAVVGWEQGNGAAFKVLGEDADGPILSAPIPMLLQKFTVGLQLGYNSVYSMLAMYDDVVFEDMVRADTAGMVMGKDIVLTGLQDDVSSTATNTHHSSSVHAMPSDQEEAARLKHTKPVRAITVSDSFMIIDVSLYGGLADCGRGEAGGQLRPRHHRAAGARGHGAGAPRHQGGCGGAAQGAGGAAGGCGAQRRVPGQGQGGGRQAVRAVLSEEEEREQKEQEAAAEEEEREEAGVRQVQLSGRWRDGA
eukprot:XP_001693912.1 predicted protein [Chlamydomonas reinhardtii]